MENAMNIIKRSVLALSFILLAPIVVAQPQDAAQSSPTAPAVPRRPLGIYAKVSISDDIAALTNAGSPTTREALNAYFDPLYKEMLGNQAISGLTVMVHWDTVNPNPSTVSFL
jgi:hypothetical protein